MAKVERLKVGDAAPRIQMTNTAGELVAIETFWADRPLLLSFLRHFG